MTERFAPFQKRIDKLHPLAIGPALILLDQVEPLPDAVRTRVQSALEARNRVGLADETQHAIRESWTHVRAGQHDRQCVEWLMLRDSGIDERVLEAFGWVPDMMRLSIDDIEQHGPWPPAPKLTLVRTRRP